MEELTNVNTILEIGKTIFSVLSFIIAYIALRKSGKSPSESVKTATDIAEEAKIYGDKMAQQYFDKYCKKYNIVVEKNNNQIKGEETSEISKG